MAPAKKISPAPSKQAGKRSSKSSPDQYTKPDLRERIKEEVLAGDKGGNAGQWSARKAQLVAHDYEAQGGGYKHPRTEAQEHLHQWTDEHWQTSDGKPAKRGDTMARYLPEKAWEALSPEEKKATNDKKRSASKGGQQFVANTRKAAKARKSAETKRSAPSKAKQPAAKAKSAKASGGSPKA